MIARNLFVFGALAIMSVSARAQTSETHRVLRQRSMVVGGTASFQHREDEDAGWQTNASIHPEILYFVAERFAVGGSIGTSYVKFDGGDGKSWTVGPALRYHFPTRWQRVLPYVSGMALFGKSRFTSSGSSSRTSISALEGSAGAMFMLSETIGVGAEAFYGSDDNEIDRTPLPSLSLSSTRYGIRARVTAFLPR